MPVKNAYIIKQQQNANQTTMRYPLTKQILGPIKKQKEILSLMWEWGLGP